MLRESGPAGIEPLTCKSQVQRPIPLSHHTTPVLCRLAQGLRRSTAYDGDDSDDDVGMFGFSSDDVNELLCQGIKPWDDCAPMALAVLRGDDDFF